MLLSIMATACVPAFAADAYASAKNGDLLAELKFGQTSGIYQSAFLYSNATNEDGSATLPTVTVSDDGKTAKIDFNPTKATGAMFYGAPIDGFTIGEGKQYTFTFKASFPGNPKDDGTINYTNAGMYANYPNTSDVAAIKSSDYKLFVGYYGTPNVRHKISAGHGSNMKGKYINNCKDYATVNLQTPDADGFFDMAFEIDGDVFRIFINGMFIEEGVYNEAHFKNANRLGFTVYLFNKLSSTTIKDVKLYKGNTVGASAQYPDYYKNPTNQLLKEYDDAKYGDLLYSPDFTATSGVWSLADASGSTRDFFDITTTKNSITFKNKGTAKGKHLGAAINGLTIYSDTEYTFSFKVMNDDNGNLGIGFAASNVLAANSFAYNLYGDFTFLNPSAVTQHCASKLSSSERATTSYTSIPCKKDADGFASIKIEMDGYKATVYYLAEDDTWAKFDSFDMTNVDYDSSGTKHANAAQGLSVACTFYVHNANASGTVKDIEIFRGLLVSEEPPAEEPPVTPEVPETPDTPAVPTGDSTLALFAVIVATLGTAVVIGKKVSSR